MEELGRVQGGCTTQHPDRLHTTLHTSHTAIPKCTAASPAPPWCMRCAGGPGTVSAKDPAAVAAPAPAWPGAGAYNALGRAWEYIIDEAAAAEAASVPLASRRMAMDVEVAVDLAGEEKAPVGSLCRDSPLQPVQEVRQLLWLWTTVKSVVGTLMDCSHTRGLRLTGPKSRSELCTAADICLSLQVASCSCSQPRQPLQQWPQLQAALRHCPAGLAPPAASQQALHLHQLAQHMQLYRLPHLLPP